MRKQTFAAVAAGICVFGLAAQETRAPAEEQERLWAEVFNEDLLSKLDHTQPEAGALLARYRTWKSLDPARAEKMLNGVNQEFPLPQKLWCALLTDPRATVRTMALNRLLPEDLSDPAVRRTLVDLLKQDLSNPAQEATAPANRPPVRRIPNNPGQPQQAGSGGPIVAVLKKAAPQEICETALPLLDSPESGLKKIGLDLLDAAIGADTYDRIVTLLKHKDPEVRQGGVAIMAKLGTDPAYQQVAKLLDDSNNEVRGVAVKRLFAYRSGELLKEKAKEIFKSDDPAQAAWGLAALCRHRPSEGKPEAQAALKQEPKAHWKEEFASAPDEQKQVRAASVTVGGNPWALAAVAQAGAQGGVRGIEYARTRRAVLRSTAAWTAAELGWKDLTPDLVRLAKDVKEAPPIRCAAIFALQKLGAKETVPELEGLLRDEEGGVRAQALHAVLRLEPGKKEFVRTLVDIVVAHEADAVSPVYLPSEELEETFAVNSKELQQRMWARIADPGAQMQMIMGRGMTDALIPIPSNYQVVEGIGEQPRNVFSSRFALSGLEKITGQKLGNEEEQEEEQAAEQGPDFQMARGGGIGQLMGGGPNIQKLWEDKRAAWLEWARGQGHLPGADTETPSEK